jgi:histidyl-tRNA synthetase
MHGVIPGVASQYSEIQKKAVNVIRSYAYDEIHLPLLEYTDLFARGVGEATDIVEKEMYSLEDRDGVSLSLRPEGTAGCVRTLEESGLLYNQTQKVFYTGPMFRYEKPQKGRYRQFNQIGVETYGFQGPDIDLELLLMTRDIWNELNILSEVSLEINNLGSVDSRLAYRSALVEYLTPLQTELDEDSKRRLNTNPLRILDSKNTKTQDILLSAPRLEDYSDEESRESFTQLCALLDGQGQDYVVNPFLVRGLDYYTDCVFEWKARGIGAQNTICAGGRYDGLVEKLGGRETPAIGFAIGLERLVLAVEQAQGQLPTIVNADVYVCMLGESLLPKGIELAEQVRQCNTGLRVRVHMGGGNLKKQFKKADASGAKWALLIGEEELEKNLVSLKDLRDSATGQSMLTVEEAIQKIVINKS